MNEGCVKISLCIFNGIRDISRQRVSWWGWAGSTLEIDSAHKKFLSEVFTTILKDFMRCRRFYMYIQELLVHLARTPSAPLFRLIRNKNVLNIYEIKLWETSNWIYSSVNICANKCSTNKRNTLIMAICFCVSKNFSEKDCINNFSLA